MKRAIYLAMFSTLLISNINVVYAEESMPNALPLIERSVVPISATSSDGVFISIPRAALTTRNGIPGVFVVEKNEARFRMVRPGKIDGTQLEVLSGLFGNEMLVVGELEAVHDGSPITVLTKKSAVKK